MNSPQLSIVVPTKDRYKYLRSLILLVEELAQGGIELVIEDNTEQNGEILSILSNRTDHSTVVKYHHNPIPCDIIKNSDNAILNSSGKYVLYIGDDDGVMPNIMEAVRLMEDQELDALTTLRPNFMWSDSKGSVHWDNMFPNVLLRGDCSLSRVDGQEELKKLLEQGMQDLGSMPRVYHGIVKRESLDKVYEIFGTFFPGPSPDMANSVALALIGVNTAFVDYPFIIAGIGKTRISGNEKGDRKKSLKDLTFLPADTQEKWDSKLPLIWTVHTIYPQTAIQVIRKFHREDILSHLNYNTIYWCFFRSHRREVSMLLRVMNFKEILHFGFSLIKKTISRLMKTSKEKINYNQSLCDIEFDDIRNYLKVAYKYAGEFKNKVK